MNRLFVYRPSEKGFDDWIGDMPFARKIITDYEAEWDSVVKFRNHKEYVKAYNYYKRLSISDILTSHIGYFDHP